MKVIKVENCLECPYSQGYYSFPKLAKFLKLPSIRICEHRGVIIKTSLDSIPKECPLENISVFLLGQEETSKMAEERKK